jgi:hypothetical protein
MVLPDQEHQQADSARQKSAFKRLFTGFPTDPTRRLDALAEVIHSFRRALADELRPVVRALLQEAPPVDGNAKKELAHRLNYVLRDAGLAIVDPDSGQATAVVAESYRLRLQTRRATSGKQTCSSNTTRLPPLDLIEYTRQEPIRMWHERMNAPHTRGHPKR